MKHRYKAYVFTHGHMDIEWYLPLRSFRYWTQEALDRLLDSPDSKGVPYVLDGQIYPLLSYLEVSPQREDEIKQAVEEGRLCIGPFFSQFDEWLPSGEGMVRNCLYGIKIAGRYGTPMRVGYLPDNFGHPGQLPQILQGFGIDSLLFMRGMPYIREDFPDEFSLVGLDGSKLTAIHFRDAYARLYVKTPEEYLPQLRPPMQITPYYDQYISYDHFMWITQVEDKIAYANEMIAYVKKAREYFPSGVIPVIIGCDHTPPHLGLAGAIEEANAIQDEIEFIAGSPQEYLKAIGEPSEEVHGELLGSRFQYILLGALSTRSYIKRMHFAAEAMLEHYAEPLDAFAYMCGGRDHRLILDEAWELMLTNQAHDSIHGSSVDEVHVEMRARYQGVMQLCAGLCHRALEQIGGQGVPLHDVLLYSPRSSPFPQYAQVWLPVDEENDDICFILPGGDGKQYTGQILRRPPKELNELGLPRFEPYPFKEKERVLVEVPMEDFCTVTPIDGSVKNQLVCTENSIENEYLKVEAEDGLIHIYDKRTQRKFYGQNLILEEEEVGDYWDTSPSWLPCEHVFSNSGYSRVSLLERGPVRAVLGVETSLNVPLRFLEGKRSIERAVIPLSFRVMLYAGVPRVDVSLTLNNTAYDHRLSLMVKPMIKTDQVISRTAFATISRPVRMEARPSEKLRQPNTILFPFREWVTLEDKDCGFGVAVKGIYDYTPIIDDITGDVGLKLTLLRGVGNMTYLNTKMRSGEAGMSPESLDAQCLGEHTIEYAFVPYVTNDYAGAEAAADTFLYPPIAHRVTKPSECGELPRRWSWDADNVRFSCFKRAWDKNGYILRLYECQGKETPLNLSLPGFSKAAMCTMEETGNQRIVMKVETIRLIFKPYEIITLRLNTK